MKAAAKKNLGKELNGKQEDAIESLADAISDAVASMTIVSGGINVQGSPTAQSNAEPITLGDVIL